MQNRPLIKVVPAAPDKALEWLAFLLLLFSWGFILFNYAGLPDSIPIHYNGSGQADGFGGKGHLLMLPIVSTVLYAVLSLLNRYLHLLNYPVHITRENALKQYTLAGRLLRYLKCVVVLLFGSIAFQTIQNAKGMASGLGIWFLPLSLGLIFIPLLYFVVKSRKP